MPQLCPSLLNSSCIYCRNCPILVFDLAWLNNLVPGFCFGPDTMEPFRFRHVHKLGQGLGFRRFVQAPLQPSLRVIVNPEVTGSKFIGHQLQRHGQGQGHDVHH